MKFGTKVIHAGVKPDPHTGAIMTPIYQTSTYVQDAPGKHKGYEYSRSQNPTREVLEKNLAAIENGNYGLCFSSGMAAIDAVLKLFKPGDEVICTRDLYGGTYRIMTRIYNGLGIKFHFVNMTNAEDIEPLINHKTKLIWIETPTNPLLNIIDIQKVCDIAMHHEIKVAVDNTFATPCLQLPLDLGADIVVHSITKYLGGHSDVIMGAIVLNDEELADQLLFIQNSCGAIPGPQDIFLVLRGIKTLEIRMERHCSNARSVVGMLKNSQTVDQVFWPGLKGHLNHRVAKSQMKDFGGMLSFTLKEDNQASAFKVLRNFKLVSLAESLGGVESLCGHPATMTHASIPKDERLEMGISDSMIRLSVGIEDPADILEDVDMALSVLGSR
ncbi:MAG: PLP-dependent aspartate aminotransferase family protein [Cyclobacteriaceae bacterium]|jgi:cystathionine beta-lyase